MDAMKITLTENSFIYQSALRNANKQLAKAVEILKRNEEKWNETLNLKLYDIGYGFNTDFELNGATIHFDDEERLRQFDEYCRMEYDYFMEWLKEMNIDENILQYVGRTSSFYLGKLHGKMMIDTLYECSAEYAFSNICLYESEDGIVVDVEESMKYEEDIKDFINDLLALTESIVEDVEDALEDITRVYNYIKDFKDNQIFNFTEWVKESWIAEI